MNRPSIHPAPRIPRPAPSTGALAEGRLHAMEATAERDGRAYHQLYKPSMYRPHGEQLVVLHLPTFRLGCGFTYYSRWGPAGPIEPGLSRERALELLEAAL